MRLRNASFLTLLLFGLCALLSLSWYTTFSGSRGKHTGDVVDVYQREFLALRDRLHSAEQENLRRSKELNLVLDEIKKAIAEKQALKDLNKTWASLSEETRLKLWNVSSSKNVLQLPSIFHHLPHLQHPESLQPAVHLGQGRTGVSMVLGVPSVKREVHSYLSDTLTSLMSELSPAEKEDCVIVVLIAEADQQYASSVSENLRSLFPAEIQAGLLEVVSPSPHFYPDFSKLRESFGDPKERVKWRTKQNLDYCFLMMYAQSKGTYYVQLEDDIVARPNYFTTMKNFDKDFGKQHLHKGHITQQQNSAPAYQGDDFFWAFTPVAGDFIRIRFFTPVRVERFFFRSGNIEHPGDKLFNTTVEVLPFDNLQAEKEALTDSKDKTPKYQRTEDGFYRIAWFHSGVCEGEVEPSFGPLEAIRLTVITDSPVWVILSEVGHLD
ncbi:hypothetical protein WMY93_011991 [Mugilogobius chulae]|uniref:Alpha-1,3-mannosyl-glycoprotein 4-beta-N-acetylglucosaminyltransferase B n=1 Tax=Mugilogobius chulae TaxID=88201 RepID=A0AAW0P5H1_9GOBI